MATKSFSRSALYMYVVGWGLFVGAGFVLFLNCNFTIQAFRASGLPETLTYGATIFIALLESAVAIFLLSPSTWGEIFRDLQEETQETIGTFSGASRISAAIVASALCSALVALVICTYWIDYQSTFEGLGIGTGEANQYRTLLCCILVFGPEASTIVGAQVLRRAREADILQAEERSRLDPARIYAKELARQRVKQARNQAKSQQWNPRGNTP
jgi:hypothetical protein